MNLLAVPAGMRTVPAPTRPPGSVADALFTERCVGCGDCVAVCPKRVIHVGPDGYPAFDAGAGLCSGCGLCADVCTHGAIEEE